MSYERGLKALHALLMDRLGIVQAVLGEPQSVPATPYLFSEAAPFESDSQEGVRRFTYRTDHTLLLDYATDPEAAELQIVRYVNSIPAAVDQDPTLGGVVRDAEIVAGEPDYTTINETEYRSVRFTSEIVEFVPYGA